MKKTLAKRVAVTERGPLYKHIEFCRNTQTLWHKLQSGRWDWLGVHPRGQFVLGRPRRGGTTDAVTYRLSRGEANEGQHGVRVQQWSGQPEAEPITTWVSTAGEARAEYERTIEQLENPSQSPVLAKVVLIQDRYPVDERFIAQVPPPNYQ